MHAPLNGPLIVTQLFASTLADKPYDMPYGDSTVHVCGHTGVDLACKVGTPVLAVWPGTIIKASWDTSGFGNCVELKADDGRVFLYGHLSAYKVSVGARVNAGEVIALSGETGNATGPHLHAEYRPATPDMLNGFRGTTDWIMGLDHQYVHVLDLHLV